MCVDGGTGYDKSSAAASDTDNLVCVAIRSFDSMEESIALV